MKHFNPFLFFLILFMVAGMALSQAQQTLPATGGKATGSGGSISYTVGQITQKTLTSTEGTVYQGVQIPFEIYVVTGIPEAKGITLECSVYPNPATDHMILKIEGNKSFGYFSALYDLKGKLIRKQEITDPETILSMQGLAPATYLLRITDHHKVIKIFKIIKK